MLVILLMVIIAEVFVVIEVEELERQHLETYKNVILELICNNTKTLVEEDIFSLLKQPPLDSMDAIRNKIVNLAKRFEVILDTDAFNKLLSDYRMSLVNSFADVGSDRISVLSTLVEKFAPVKETDIIKFPKKEFTAINKKMKKEAKKIIIDSNQILLNGLPLVFKDRMDEECKNDVISIMSKYLASNYCKDLVESMELKLIIKDTTLINSVLEQGERYLFTKTNSHLFD